MKDNVNFLPELFLRAPYYSFAAYDLDRVPQVLGDIAFQNAIFLASAEFYQLLERKNFDYTQLNEKEIHTINKYYNRMCFRPTPFGSFASFSLLEWGRGDTVRLAGDDEAILHLLPDNGLLRRNNKNEAGVSEQDWLIKNPALYRLGKEFRYIKSLPDAKGLYQFSIDAISAEKFNRELIALFRRQPVNALELLSWISERSGSTIAEAKDYLNFLIDEQVLFNQRTGNIIGEHKRSHSQHVVLVKTGSLAFIDKEHIDVSARGEGSQMSTWYAALERKVSMGGPDLQDQENLSKAIQVLQLLSPQQQPSALSSFKELFQARFDQQRVPLLQALDPDAGISYGNLAIGKINGTILQDIKFPEPKNSEVSEWTEVHRVLFRLWAEKTEHDRNGPLIITSDSVAHLGFAPPQGNLATTTAIVYRQTADHLLLEHAGGATAVSLIGRFSVFSTSVASLCQKLADLESDVNPDVVFADIGQLSDMHADNINRREQIFPFEIPVNVFSTIPQAQQITPDDLLVSVINGEVVLESKRLQKRVIPRLATAYNFQRNQLALFRFLCDLQYQNVQSGLNFDLEAYFPGCPFYPRVMYGKVVISPARWILNERELKELREVDTSSALKHLKRIRDVHQLPQLVSTGVFDQQLVFDLSNERESKFFLQCITNKKQLTLQEYLLPDKSVKRGNKPMLGQFIAFLFHQQSTYRPSERKKITKGKLRSFLPGSEWLYLKIFCNAQQSDGILTRILAPLLRKQGNEIIQWFFIRYTEDGYHLRVRLKMNTESIGSFLNELNNRIKNVDFDGTIRSVQSDTYKRELERYGELIEEAEDLFYRGSELVVNFAEQKDKQQQIPDDFSFGLLTAWCMISCFMKEVRDFTKFTGKVAEALFHEFSGDKILKVSLDQKYRLIKKDINLVLGNRFTNKLPTPMSKRMELLKNSVTAIAVRLDGMNDLEREMLIADLIHMQLNRTFRDDQRKQELLLYFCLQKYSMSLLAKAGSVNMISSTDKE